MVIVVNNEKNELSSILERLEKENVRYEVINDEGKDKVAVINGDHLKDEMLTLEAVEKVDDIKKKYKLASREFKKEDTVIDINGVKIGGDNFVMMTGPCSIENREMMIETATAAKAAGAQILRGGAFKPRTSPYDFQGLGEEGLKYMREAADLTGMIIVTEIMKERDFELIEKYTDIFQIGARNMQNFDLLKTVGGTKKPVLLKRGMSATVEDLLMAAEYIMAHGNPNVILCERGIRTFETYTRNTVDINVIPAVKELSHLPIIIDASHGTGRRNFVEPITLAGIVAGADGAMVEIHPTPEKAFSDGPQSLTLPDFTKFMDKLKKYVEFEGKKLG